MSSVRAWLAGIGLGRYADAFEANDVEMDLLKDVDDSMLRDIGVTSAGHRLRLRNAIAKLAPTPDVKENTNSTIAAPEVAAESGERRPLTVMFCDLIGSTALSARLDPEDLREVIRSYQSCVATTTRPFDGFIARYVGDGVLIYFGWPEARETDAERAVRAGVAVATAVSAAPVGGELLQVRIGIATGLVVIGEPIGSGDSRQQTAVGETPNLAAPAAGPRRTWSGGHRQRHKAADRRPI
jgi:class 3 adenylate cyclase